MSQNLPGQFCDVSAVQSHNYNRVIFCETCTYRKTERLPSPLVRQALGWALLAAPLLEGDEDEKQSLTGFEAGHGFANDRSVGFVVVAHLHRMTGSIGG